MGNGPTEDEAGIMDHDQLSQHSEEGDEVSPLNITRHQPVGQGYQMLIIYHINILLFSVGL